VHDWLPLYAGAERVLEQILHVFPEADVWSLLDFIPEGERGFLQNKRVATSFIQSLPFVRSHYRSYLPLMPLAIEQFDLSGYDLVISSSYAVAKGVITGPDQLHICYCHSPIRYAWDMQGTYLHEAGLTRGVQSMLARALLHYLRLWDYRTAIGVNQFVTNSEFIARRIGKVYGRTAKVIHPPVDTESFRPNGQRGDYYLTASRLVPYKKVGLIVEAFAKLPDRKLIVIGDGPEFAKIKRTATANVQMLGHQEKSVLVGYMQGARAFVFAAEEDFGIVAVEAQACGAPVIAFARGGSAETVVPGETGWQFHEQTAGSIRQAVLEFEDLEFDGELIRRHAERYSTPRFRRDFSAFVESEWSNFRGVGPPSPRDGRSLLADLSITPRVALGQ